MVAYALTFLMCLAAENPASQSAGQVIALPAWEPSAGTAVPWRVGKAVRDVRIWGGQPSRAARVYFDERLPACFRRSLIPDGPGFSGTTLDWIFTGEHGGFTVRIAPGRVRVAQRFYDSFGFNTLGDGGQVEAARHPEKAWHESEVMYSGPLREVELELDHRLQLIVRLNGREALRQTCLFDVSRHQLAGEDSDQTVAGRMVRPPADPAAVRIDDTRRHQTMIGFGGIATPAAYAQLGPEGRRRWWRLVCEYNLLIQREYPIGTRLNERMDNWDTLADATPHYYGDNFPNGEISDFDYLRTLRRLGGEVWFEFWALPPWATREWIGPDGKARAGVADVERYVEAMLAYCRTSKDRAGAPPDVVGIQNELRQPAELWHEMTLKLRQGLDAAGFGAVKIHMSDSGALRGGLTTAKTFRQSAAAWAAIDFAATHMYDYQGSFTDPDRYDAMLREWNQLTGDKPFLSTELCINNPAYQWPTYRVALTMGQLYHKNLTIADAAAICYCWTLLNVVQPSYGWTRTLVVPDETHGGVPAASSRQLRVFGAYSRRVMKGMTRVEAESSAPDLLVTAFAGDQGRRTLVLLNRASVLRTVRVPVGDPPFAEMEICGPYHENEVQPVPPAGADGTIEVAVEPGAIVTLTNVPLGRLPEAF